MALCAIPIHNGRHDFIGLAVSEKLNDSYDSPVLGTTSPRPPRVISNLVTSAATATLFVANGATEFTELVV